MQEIIYFLPGQGSEVPGIGKKLLNKFKEAEKYLKITEEIWGENLKEVIIKEKEIITDIKYSQPILCWYSFSLGFALKNKYKIKILVPYSLGVFPAIALSEMLPYEDVLKILKFNFDKVNEFNIKGKLLYVSGYHIKEAKKNLNKIFFSSINHPLSYTIGGEEGDIINAYNFLKDKAFSLKILPSPWAIHTPLLKKISTLLEKNEGLWENLKDGNIKILSPIDLRIIEDKESGKFLLIHIISKTMLFNSVCKKLEKEDSIFIEGSESNFFQKIFKLHKREIKVLEGINEI